MSKPVFSNDRPLGDFEEDRAPTVTSFRLFVILIVGMFAIGVALLWRSQSVPQDGEVHRGVGQAMGPFELIPLVGADAPLTLDDLRGKVVLINFWGTWCGPCMLEFPHLVEMNEHLKTVDGFRFVAISCGQAGPDLETEPLQAATEAYLRRSNFELDVYSDRGAGARLGLMKAAQLPGFGFPTTVLLDREGIIRGLWQGYRPNVEAEMEEAILDLLKS